MAVLLWSPVPQGPSSPIGHLDLMIHLGLFLMLGSLLKATAGGNSTQRTLRTAFGLGLLGALVFETGQWFVPGRSVNLLDYATNGLAVVLGVLALPGGKRYRNLTLPVVTSGFSLAVGFTGIFFGEKLLTNFQPQFHWPTDFLVTGGSVFLLALETRRLIRELRSARWSPSPLFVIGAVITSLVLAPTWAIFILAGAAIAMLLERSQFLPNFRQAGRTVVLSGIIMVSIGGIVGTHIWLNAFGIWGVGTVAVCLMAEIVDPLN